MSIPARTSITSRERGTRRLGFTTRKSQILIDQSMGHGGEQAVEWRHRDWQFRTRKGNRRLADHGCASLFTFEQYGSDPSLYAGESLLEARLPAFRTEGTWAPPRLLKRVQPMQPVSDYDQERKPSRYERG